MELLAIRSDLAFRAVFGRDNERCKVALKELLHTALDLEVADLRYVNPLNLQAYEGDKQSEMDIEVVTAGGERIDIEIQLRVMNGFRERIVYYGAKLLGEAMVEKQSYDKMKKCKVLSILDFNLFPNSEDLMNRFVLMERKRYFEYSDIFELVFLEMPKLEEKSVEEMEPVEKWLYFLKYVQDEKRRPKIEQIIAESEGLQMAYEVLFEVSADEKMRALIRMQDKAEHDAISRLAYAEEQGMAKGIEQGIKKGIEKGIEQGIEKGIEQGIEKGIEQGIEKGIEKGMEKGIMESAIKFLPKLDDETISETLELPIAMVQALRTEHCPA